MRLVNNGLKASSLPSSDTMAGEAAPSATHPALVDTHTNTLTLRKHIQTTGGHLFNIQIV